MIRRPPRSTLSSSSAASDVYKRQSLCVAAQATQGAGRSRGGPGQPGSRNRQVRQLARARTRLRSRRLDSRYILVVQAPPQVPEALYRWAHVSLTMIPGTVTVRPWSRGPTDKLDRESPRASRPPVCRGLELADCTAATSLPGVGALGRGWRRRRLRDLSGTGDAKNLADLYVSVGRNLRVRLSEFRESNV